MWAPRKTDLYRFWGRLPRAYDLGVNAYFLGRLGEWRRQAVEAVGLRPGDRVLDLACGAGANLALLEEQVGPTGTIVALDPSIEMLGAARRQAGAEGWRNIEFIEGHAARDALPDSSLDGALCTLGLSVIPGHRDAIGNVHRALKDGGRFVALDAGLYSGLPSLVNPWVRHTFRQAADAEADRDIVGALRAECDRVEVERFHAGSVFIAVATRSR